MPAKIAIDKQILLRYLGVEVILVDPAINGFKGLLDRVEQLKNEMENVYVVDQFTNPANPDAHFRWTGPEIWKDTGGKVDILVAASGSGGTLTGTGRQTLSNRLERRNFDKLTLGRRLTGQWSSPKRMVPFTFNRIFRGHPLAGCLPCAAVALHPSLPVPPSPSAATSLCLPAASLRRRRTPSPPHLLLLAASHLSPAPAVISAPAPAAGRLRVAPPCCLASPAGPTRGQGRKIDGRSRGEPIFWAPLHRTAPVSGFRVAPLPKPFST